MQSGGRWCLALAAALTIWAAQAQAQVNVRKEGTRWVRTEAGTASMSPAESLRLMSMGQVDVRGGTANELRYSVRLVAREADQKRAEKALQGYQVSLSRQGGTLLLTIAGDSRQVRESITEIVVPPQFGQLAVESGGGKISAGGFTAQVLARTGGGQMDLDQIRGKVRLESAGGIVKLGRIRGGVHCLSGGGTIRADEIDGDAVFETGGGEISLGVVTGEVRASTNGGQISLQRGGSTARLRTAGGEIKVIEAGGHVIADSGGGGIKVSSALSVQCESAAGSIVLEDVTGAMRAITAIGSIVARLPQKVEFRESTLSTASGDITVYIPVGLPITIRARAQSEGSGGKIQSDFPEIQPTAQSEWSVGRSEVNGAINGGGPVLRLLANDGTIYLRRQR